MIDRKYQILAVNPCNGHIHTEKDSLLLVADDRAVPIALRAYLEECEKLGCGDTHLESVALLIDRVENILEQDKDLLVPIRKIWQQLNNPPSELSITLTELIDILKSNDKFVVYDSGKGNVVIEKELDDELESLGFYRGPKVRLKKRVPNRTEIKNALSGNLSAMLSALQKAYKVRPQDDEIAEDRLLEIMSRTKKLKDDLNKIFDGENSD